MAHKKGVGSTKNGRDSEAKRLGVKRADGQFVLAGTKRGGDDTIYAIVDGVVKFERMGKDRKLVLLLTKGLIRILEKLYIIQNLH